MNIRAIFTVDRVVSGYTPPQPFIRSHLKQNLTANDPNAPVANEAEAKYAAKERWDREYDNAQSDAPETANPNRLQPGEFAMNCGDGRTLIGTLSFQVRNPELTPSGLIAGAVHYIDFPLND